MTPRESTGTPSSTSSHELYLGTLLYLGWLERIGFRPSSEGTNRRGAPPPHLTAGDDAILEELDRILEASPDLMLTVGEGAEMKTRPLAELLTLDELLSDADVERIVVAVAARAIALPTPSER